MDCRIAWGRGAIDDIREFEKESIISEDDSHRGQDDVQKLTDKSVKQIDDHLERKEAEVMKI